VRTGGTNDREHYWDTLRAFAMLLGIPYHVALSYRPGQQWIVRSDEGLSLFTSLAQAIHLFRMPAFFLIAGYFAGLLLARRDPLAWLKGRFLRLGVPFVTTIFTLVPMMNLACELSNLPFSAALSSLMHNSMSSGGYWVRHLWFIIVLLYCCSAAALLAHRFPSLRTALLPETLDKGLALHFTLALLGIALVLGLWQAAAVEAFYIAGLNTNLPQQILRLDELIIYAPWFVLGCLLQRMPLTQARFSSLNGALIVAAVAFTGLSLTIGKELHPALGRLVATMAAVPITQMLVAAARTWFDRPSPLARQLTDAAFVIYLFHMPAIIVLVWLGQSVPVHVAIKAPAIMALSLALSWLFWRVIGRSPKLLFRFNGTASPAGLRPAAA
jgi:glucan biosynthesis protein C